MSSQVLKRSIYSSDELARLGDLNVPHHIAFMMDGNRRWAKERGRPATFGHKRGVDVIEPLLRASKEIGVKVVTLYAFSTENWNRSKLEVAALFRLLEQMLKNKKDILVRDNVRLKTIGDLSALPSRLQLVIDEVIDATKECSELDLVLAINYGARDEMSRATKKILQAIREGSLSEDELSPESFSRYLDTADMPDPDLLIRTGGAQRVSNFLLWQISYTEIFITDVRWPDFTAQTLLDAVVEFQQRKRNLGA